MNKGKSYRLSILSGILKGTMGVKLYAHLRVKAAKALGIDPDRITITARTEPGSYVAEVEGPISPVQDYELRRIFNDGTALHIKWLVRSTIV